MAIKGGHRHKIQVSRYEKESIKMPKKGFI